VELEECEDTEPVSLAEGISELTLSILSRPFTVGERGNEQ